MIRRSLHHRHDPDLHLRVLLAFLPGLNMLFNPSAFSRIGITFIDFSKESVPVHWFAVQDIIEV